MFSVGMQLKVLVGLCVLFLQSITGCVQLYIFRDESDDNIIRDSNLGFLKSSVFAEDGQGGEKTEEPTAKKLEDTRTGTGCQVEGNSKWSGTSALFLVLRFGREEWELSLWSHFHLYMKRYLPYVIKWGYISWGI